MKHFFAILQPATATVKRIRVSCTAYYRIAYKAF